MGCLTAFSFNTSSKLPGPMEVAFLTSFFIGSISLSFPIFSSQVCHTSHFQCVKSPKAMLTTRHREHWTHLRWETRVPAGSQAHHCLGSSWLEREQCAGGPQPQTPSLGPGRLVTDSWEPIAAHLGWVPLCGAGCCLSKCPIKSWGWIQGRRKSEKK